jgi:hypothetical protein
MIFVIYSATTGRIRSIIVPQGNEKISPNLLAGEAVQQFDMSVAKQDLNTLQASLNAITGLSPANDRFAIIDNNGNVTGAVIADPSCGDVVPACQLVASPNATIGWKFQAGVFIPPIIPISLDPPKVINGGVVS